jgi:hypothetical protein
MNPLPSKSNNAFGSCFFSAPTTHRNKSNPVFSTVMDRRSRSLEYDFEHRQRSMKTTKCQCINSKGKGGVVSGPISTIFTVFLPYIWHFWSDLDDFARVLNSVFSFVRGRLIDKVLAVTSVCIEKTVRMNQFPWKSYDAFRS